MSAHLAEIPAHVPPPLVVDFDFYGVQAIEGDLHRGWSRLHQQPDIFYTPRNGGHWVFTRADDLVTAYRDWERFSSETVTIPKPRRKQFRFAPAEFDPPLQTAYRRLIQPAFVPAKLQMLQAKAHKLADGLLAELILKGRCEFVTEFAQQFPIGVFLSIVDLPLSEAPKLIPMVDAFLRNPDAATRIKGLRSMLAYLDAVVHERRTDPGADLISHVVASTVEGRPITHEECLSICADLMFAGLDTMVSSTSFFIRFLAANPVHRRQLVETPTLIPDAVEELLRYHGVTNLGRCVKRDMEYKGITFREGDMVLLPTTLFGLDERQFNDPLTVDFKRVDKNHMIFGSGPHLCMGFRLARIELCVFLKAWLSRVPEFRLDPDRPAVPTSGGTNGMAELPLRWD